MRSGTEVIENKLFYSVSKLVPRLNDQDSENIEQTNVSSSSCLEQNSSPESSSVKSNLMSSSIPRTEEHNSSLYDDIGSSSKQERSGQIINFYGFLPIPIPDPMPTVSIVLIAQSNEYDVRLHLEFHIYTILYNFHARTFYMIELPYHWFNFHKQQHRPRLDWFEVKTC